MWIELSGCRFWSQRVRSGLILGLVVISLIALGFTPRIPLGIGYHDFADKRSLLGIPNCLDVLSNIPFFVAGAWGVLWLLTKAGRESFVERWERLPYVVFFAGVALTGIGSFWYHLEPGNDRLPWDLVPMTFSFMSMVVAIVMERISTRIGLLTYIPLLLLGITSVGYWYITESQGRGDYRFYLFVQFFSPVLLAVVVWLFPPRYTGSGYLVFAFILFVLAKVMERFDSRIYAATGIVSGHSLKHVTAGLACYWVLRMLQRRRPFVAIVKEEFRVRSSEFAADHLRH
jgi:hypothetical protein